MEDGGQCLTICSHARGCEPPNNCLYLNCPPARMRSRGQRVSPKRVAVTRICVSSSSTRSPQVGAKNANLYGFDYTLQ